MTNNWPQLTDGGDWFRQIERRLGRTERMQAPISASDLLGPGMSSQAVNVLDWNDEITTFNGFFYSYAGAYNAPVIKTRATNPDTGRPEGPETTLDPLPWTGMTIARDDGTGLQQVWNTDEPEAMWYRVRNFIQNPDDPEAPVIFSEWMKWPTQSGFIDGNDLHPDINNGIGDAYDNALHAIELAVEAIDLHIPPNYVFYQPEPPEGTEERPLMVGDFWFDTDDGNHMYTWDGSAWVDPADAILAEGATAAQAAAAAAQAAAAEAASAITDAATAQAAADAAHAEAVSAAAAAAEGITDAAAAQSAADAAQAAADAALDAAEAAAGLAGNHIYNQSSEPTGGTYALGDIWNDTDDGNKQYRWNGSAWVAMVTAWLETDSAASRGIKITSTGLVAYDSGGTATFSITGSTGAVAMKGDLTSGSTVTGAVVTGGTVQTTSTASRGVKITTAGLVAYDSGGTPTFTIDASTGAVAMVGALTSGSTVSGATVTGGTVQTSSSASTGLKLTTTGLVAYNGSGSPTFTIDASTGAVAMVGDLQSGSTVSGAVVTGGTLQTSASANVGVKITSGGLIAYGSSVAKTIIDSSTGILSTTDGVYTGGNMVGASVTASSTGVIQTESTANRGIKMNSNGMVVYAGASAVYPISPGDPTLTILASDGSIAMLGNLLSGSTVAGATITGSTLKINDTIGATGGGLRVDTGGIKLYKNGGQSGLITGSGSTYTGDSLVRVDAVTPYSGALRLYGGTGNTQFYMTVDSDMVEVRNGRIYSYDTGVSDGSEAIYTAGRVRANSFRMSASQTTGHAGNTYTDTSGIMYRSTSSVRYKNPLGPVSLSEHIETLKTWETQSFTRKDSDDEKVYLGYYAEDLHESGLTPWVDYDENGNPDGVAYAYLVLPLIEWNQQLEQRIADLEAAINVQ